MYWRRGETFGKGGFGFVSKAKTYQEDDRNPMMDCRSHPCLPPVVAVKSSKTSESKSLLKEKQLLDQFKTCPSILQCYGDDITVENGEELYNIILEYASGGCLVDRIQAGKGLPEHDVRNYTKSVLTALNHMHRLGYAHCDVKPHNVLLVKEGVHDRDLTAKLADFGSVKSLKARSNLEADEDREGERRFHGTYLYAAPESIAHLEYLPESDVWAVGCCVLHLLTGESPWKIDREKDTAMDILFKIGCSDQIPEIPKRISKEARDFLMRCFVKDPRGRCQADALLQHPFVAKATGSCSSHHHHHFHLSARRIQSMLVPHCFHPVHAM